MTIRSLRRADLDAVVATHVAAFPQSALTRLGVETIRRYYEWQLTGPHDAVVLGAFDSAELAGFCFGGKFRGATEGFIRKNRLYLAWRVLTRPWLIANPVFRERLSYGLSIFARLSSAFLQTNAGRPRPQSSTRSFGILAIAVHPRCQRWGVGNLLMDEAEKAARAGGYPQMNLTVHPDNGAAVRFYESRRWIKVPSQGVWHGKMIKSL